MHGERVGPTVAVWAGALIGAAYKLAFPVGLRRPSLVAFAALASFVMFGLRPILVSRAPPAVGLIPRRRCALYRRRGDSSPTDAVSHANLAWFCDCRRRLPLRRGPSRCGAGARLERRSNSLAREPSSGTCRSRPTIARG